MVQLPVPSPLAAWPARLANLVLRPSSRAATAALAAAPPPKKVSLHPSIDALPGGAELQSLVNGIGGWALVAALVGLVIGAAAWALGAHSQNYHQSVAGRRAVLVSGIAALLIGAAPYLIDWFYNAGKTLG